MVREKGTRRPWHIDEPILSCPERSGITAVTGEWHIFKVWLEQSRDTGKLYMLDHHGNEIRPEAFCETCAGRVLKLLKWRNSDEGRLETEQQEPRGESEERDFRSKGLAE